MTKQNNMTTAERLLAGIKESASRASIARPFEIDMREQQVAEAITYLFSLQCAQTGKVADISPMVVKAIEKAAHWLVNPERVSLKILGTPGTGKQRCFMPSGSLFGATTKRNRSGELACAYIRL